MRKCSITKMTKYLNLSGKSGVTRYEIGSNYIIVEFVDKVSHYDRIYLYTNAATGTDHIDEMRRLALLGRGLHGYINTHLKGKLSHFKAKCKDDTMLSDLRKQI